MKKLIVVLCLLQVEEMGLNNSTLENEVRDAKKSGNKPASSAVLSFTNIFPRGEDSSQITEQAGDTDSLDTNTTELPSQVNKSDLNLIVPHSIGSCCCKFILTLIKQEFLVTLL